MSESKHTPEPWAYYDDRKSTGRIEIVGLGKTVSRIYLSVPDEDVANARRIVACVNACAGMTNEQIDNVCMISGSLLNRFGEQMAYLGQVEKQRDELLAFAEEVRRSGDTRLASMAIAAIASIKGGAK